MLLSGCGEAQAQRAEDLVAVAGQRYGADRTYELIGPRPMTFAEATADIATALGRPIAYEQVTAEQLVADLVRAGLPRDEACCIGAALRA
ncbi:hypothetical protein [Nocardioides sp. Root140]|uniref:hypothetical protein n=1 Tax=Nocardioides sp. Root140 TaxID=1736460 RepID=UPI0006FAB455|nr:hypothetical protein [Nocardioides sp. Root140]KQY62502.1 hypothetical protein ASD30_24395 [Nocardioides sp. Root140]